MTWLLMREYGSDVAGGTRRVGGRRCVDTGHTWRAGRGASGHDRGGGASGRDMGGGASGRDNHSAENLVTHVGNKEDLSKHRSEGRT